MKTNITIFLILIFTTQTYASNAQLVDEKEINKWGYNTQSYKIEKKDGKVLKKQHIKSIKNIKGSKTHYYYYNLSEECFSNYFSSIKRRSSLIFLDKKDYTLSDMSGKCVRIINTAAYMDTFTEQPRIFTLFKKYLNAKTHNKQVKTVR